MSSLEATVISIYPFEIKEAKPGMIPPEFILPAVKDGDFEILHVGLCRAYIYLDYERGSIPMTEFADVVANSIVRDFITSQVEYRGDHCKPGLMFLPGKYTKEQIKKDFEPELKALREAQNQWFIQLVKAADDSWNRLHRHSEISDTQRMAARKLNLKRDWVVDYVSIGSDGFLASVTK